MEIAEFAGNVWGGDSGGLLRSCCVGRNVRLVEKFIMVVIDIRCGFVFAMHLVHPNDVATDDHFVSA